MRKYTGSYTANTITDEQKAPEFTLATTSYEESLKFINTVAQSVAVIAMFTRIDTSYKKLEFLLNDELQIFGNASKKVTKMPGGMLLPGENWEQAMTRRFSEEINIVPTKYKLSFVGDFSSTNKTGKHFKVFVVVTEFEGKLLDGGKGDIVKTEWRDFEGLKGIAKSQKPGIYSCLETIKTISKEFWMASFGQEYTHRQFN
jgi:hypothetical protein